MSSRQRASSAPTSRLLSSQSAVREGFLTKCQFWVQRYAPDPWQQVLLNLLDQLVDRTFIQYWNENQLNNCKLYNLGALIILLVAIIFASYLLLVESVLQFWLPFYAAATFYYWLVLWRRNVTKSFDEKSHGLLLCGWFCGELVIVLLCQRFECVYFGDILSLVLPLLSFGLVHLSARFDHFLLTKTLTPASIGIYFVRIFCLRSFTLVPSLFRPFFAYSACFVGSMATQLTSKHKQLSMNDKGEKSPSFSFHSLPRMAQSLSEPGTAKPIGPGVRNRRTSLPASAGALVVNRQQSNISEARGLVVDLLADRDLPGNVTSCLRAVAHLLNPSQPALNLHIDMGLPQFVLDPYSGEEISITSNKARVTNITFSTVTSATGLPTIVAEPNRARSSSFWRQKSEEAISPRESLEPKLSLGEISDKVIQISDGTTIDLVEIERDLELQRLQEWGFPIFRFAANNPHTVLTRTAYNIFKRTDLLRVFKIPVAKFLNFFHQLELGYWDIPYHNRLHATDVLHSCYFLTVHPIEFCQNAESGPKGEPLKSVMSSLELMALYTAAAMHDYDHPGKTNAFLVAVEDRKAILYNDRSVLENHHAASAWSLLTQPNNFFLDQLDAAECRRLRYLVLEFILATDLKRHFEIIMDFNAKVKSDTLDLQEESDRMLINEMYIKMSDINSPTKPRDLHKQWTERIVAEFFAQGDEEKKRGMVVSPYMDRNENQVAKLQDSFIAHIVSPLAVALSEAAVLPVLSTGIDDESELIINLNKNHQLWKNELGDDESAEPLQNERSISYEDQHEMETIVENEEDEEFC